MFSLFARPQHVFGGNHPSEESICRDPCRGMPLINQNWHHAHAASHLEPGHLISDFVHDLLADRISALDLNHIDSVPRLQKKVDLATFQALRLANSAINVDLPMRRLPRHVTRDATSFRQRSRNCLSCSSLPMNMTNCPPSKRGNDILSCFVL